MAKDRPVLLAEKISKTFLAPQPLVILEDISLSLYPEESIAICGRSGEGKTTLLHILGTIDDPSEGKLIISGKEVLKSTKDKIRNQHIGFVFQAFHLFSEETVLDNVLMPLRIGRKSVSTQSEGYKRAIELLEMVGLEKRLDFPTYKLSGGERQRVSIARALVGNPDIIIADEPTGSLDHKTADEIQDLLFQSIKHTKKTLIVATHNLQLAKLCTSCYELEDRKIKQKL